MTHNGKHQEPSPTPCPYCGFPMTLSLPTINVGLSPYTVERAYICLGASCYDDRVEMARGTVDSTGEKL